MDEITSYQCQPCGRIFSTEEQINSHILRCDGSGREERVKENLERYRRGEQLNFSEEKGWGCTYCNCYNEESVKRCVNCKREKKTGPPFSLKF